MEKIAKLLLLPLILVIAVSIVYAADDPTITAVTLTKPASSATVGNQTGNGTSAGKMILNCSVTGGVANASLYNITYQAQSASTANSSWVTIATRTLANCSTLATSQYCRNTTVILAQQGGADGSVYLEDANNYQFRVTITQADNTTNTKTSSANTGITVDNTVPTAPTNVAPHDIKYQNGAVNVEINGTVTAGKTTSCKLYWAGEKTPTGNRIDAMIHSGSTCTLAMTFVPDGTYEYYIRASDETNTTDCAARTVTFDNAQASPKARIIVSEESGVPTEPGQGINKGAALVVIVAFAVGLYYLFGKK